MTSWVARWKIGSIPGCGRGRFSVLAQFVIGTWLICGEDGRGRGGYGWREPAGQLDYKLKNALQFAPK